MNDVEAKIRRSEEVENPKDLATCNRLLLDQQRLEDQEGFKNFAFSFAHQSEASSVDGIMNFIIEFIFF